MARRSIKKSYDFFSTYSWHVPGMSGVFVMLVLLLAGMLLGSLLLGLLLLFMPAEQATGFGMPVIYIVQFIPALIYSANVSHRNALFDDGYALDNNHFSPLGGLAAAILVSLATIALSVASDPLGSILPPVSETWKNALSSITGGPIWISLLSVSVLAPVFEEWLCRGIVLRGLLNCPGKFKPSVAIIISALFFAVIHGNPWQGMAAFLLGALFGYVYWRTGSLKLTMLMHCVNNTLSVLLTKAFPQFEDVDSFRELMSPEAYMITVVCGLLVLAACVWLISGIKPLSQQGSCRVIPAEDMVSQDQNPV